MTSPAKQYQRDLAKHLIQPDEHQARAVDVLQRIYEQFSQSGRAKNFFSNLLPLTRKTESRDSIKGAYFWGPVGTGKTYLMDLFYRCLKVPKQRQHFHEFMQDIHNQLKKLEGHKNPLDIVAEELAKKIKVLCFDEFVVNNIVDAMVLRNLLTALFKQGICLVTTSNTEPDELYKDGLQRELFLPAIDLIKKHLEVLEINNQVDYRLRQLTPEKAYFSIKNDNSEQELQRWFDHASQGDVRKNTTIKVMDRNIDVKQVSDNVLWCEFDVLCNVPRSQRDYLAIAEQYQTILLSGVHQISENQRNIARLFINLVDVLYNAKVRLIMSADVGLDDIYTGGELREEFKRTHSRLVEMQSKEYLSGKIND
ncbi:MAG: cell division protein ZapE [Legionellaceae bacterium]|nr:cell division protein ZapE [Legionellaceae bacterium]